MKINMLASCKPEQKIQQLPKTMLRKTNSITATSHEKKIHQNSKLQSTQEYHNRTRISAAATTAAGRQPPKPPQQGNVVCRRIWCPISRQPPAASRHTLQRTPTHVALNYQKGLGNKLCEVDADALHPHSSTQAQPNTSQAAVQVLQTHGSSWTTLDRQQHLLDTTSWGPVEQRRLPSSVQQFYTFLA
jgi:hypothetical protein